MVHGHGVCKTRCGRPRPTAFPHRHSTHMPPRRPSDTRPVTCDDCTALVIMRAVVIHSAHYRYNLSSLTSCKVVAMWTLELPKTHRRTPKTGLLFARE